MVSGVKAFRRILACAAVVSNLAIGVPVAAATIEWREGPGELGALHLTGEIRRGDADVLARVWWDQVFLTGAAATGRTRILLNSPGGDLTEALRIGRFVHELKIMTVAPSLPLSGTPEATRPNDPPEVCLSSCAFIWLAGPLRSGTLVGFHRPYRMEQGREQESVAEAAKLIDEYIAALGEDPTIRPLVMSKGRDAAISLSELQARTTVNLYSQAFDETVTNLCGSSIEALRNASIETDLRRAPEATATAEKQLECESKALAELQRRAMTEYVGRLRRVEQQRDLRIRAAAAGVAIVIATMVGLRLRRRRN